MAIACFSPEKTRKQIESEKAIAAQKTKKDKPKSNKNGKVAQPKTQAELDGAAFADNMAKNQADVENEARVKGDKKTRGGKPKT